MVEVGSELLKEAVVRGSAGFDGGHFVASGCAELGCPNGTCADH